MSLHCQGYAHLLSPDCVIWEVSSKVYSHRERILGLRDARADLHSALGHRVGTKEGVVTCLAVWSREAALGFPTW